MAIDFSIVLPAYNDLELFRSALESVRCQKGVIMEIIVVDDSVSNDDIERYVLSLDDPRIIYLHNSPSLGAVKNWNKGLGLCHGANIVVLHHDESLRGSTYLSHVKEEMREADVAVSNIEVHHRDGKVYGLYSERMKLLSMHHPSLLFAVNTLGPCSVLTFKHSILTYFDERLRWFVDVEWYYRLLKGHSSVYIPSACIVSHDGHSGQITRTIDADAVSKADSRILSTKYSSELLVRAAVWFQIYVLHNTHIRRTLRKLSGR